MRLSAEIAMAVLVVGSLVNCSSITAHYVGNPSSGEEVGGIPIVVERPRWFKVTYRTVTYAHVTTNEKTTPDGKNRDFETVLSQLAPVQEIAIDIVAVGEVYALDLKRPAAGSADYEIGFPDGRFYPKLVKGKVEDKTIQEMRETLDKLLQQIPKALAGVPTAGIEPSAGGATVVKLSESVKRIELYDISNPKSGPILTFTP